jgi:hypothetical protein
MEDIESESDEEGDVFEDAWELIDSDEEYFLHINYLNQVN